VRDAYDKVAAKYADRFADELRHKPLDRALLAAFAEQAGPDGPVIDIGCGPGHITAHLASLGLTVRGIDLSPGMIDVARARYPGLSFEVGQMHGLSFGDGEVAGAILFYSIIHLTPAERAATFAELAGLLRPGGPMLVAFQTGNGEQVHADSWFGEEVSLDGYRPTAQSVADQITAAGLAVDMIANRAPYPEIETAQRCYLLARRPRPGDPASSQT
jgi:SAM-dependent methyltransferase